MKIKSFIIAGLALCAMTSCDESFDDWAQQSGNDQPAVATFGEGTVAAACSSGVKSDTILCSMPMMVLCMVSWQRTPLGSIRIRLHRWSSGSGYSSTNSFFSSRISVRIHQNQYLQSQNRKIKI